jgi:hypothetical protein
MKHLLSSGVVQRESRKALAAKSVHHLIALAVAVLLGACHSTEQVASATSPQTVGGQSFRISDQAHGDGIPGFYFLPPLVKATTYGVNKRGLSPVVKIEELAPGTRGIIATFTTISGTFGPTIKVDSFEHYQVNWDTKPSRLDPKLTYRIHVWLENFELGFADVDVVEPGSEIKNVQTSEHIPLLDGRTLPIKFRIQQEALKCVGVVCAAQDRCHLGVCNPTTGVCSQAPAATCPVFVDDYAPGVSFTPFGGSTNDVTRDPTTLNNGRASLKVFTVGGGGAYTGGALVAAAPLDLSAYNALSFWAKASPGVSWDHMGFGDTAGATGDGLEVELHNTLMGGSFQKYYFPIPNPAALASARGLFFFADGVNPGTTAWFNDVRYETLDPTTFASMFGTVYYAYVPWPVLNLAPGATFQMDFNPNTVYYTVGPTLYRVGWNYFTLFSDNTDVATVDANGLITGQGGLGTAGITANLGTFPVPGQAVVTGSLPLAGPTTLPPLPAPISLYVSQTGGFSGSTVVDKGGNADTWLACWSGGTGGAPYAIPGFSPTASPRNT